tara:strand:+ start:4513 stop:5472 length:960 start_codon:yes stop_codon:yes gene_type:complete
MWSEIARPKVITDIVGQRDLVQDVSHWKASNTWPTALLFVGPPGTGKTSTARVIANEMLGEHNNDFNFFETNGSDDRGIDFVRTELKTLLRTKPVGVDRKIVLIDEADGLTSSAQDAMRQLIETYSSNVLVILTGNELEKIRPAIRSRCRTYTFKPITPDEGSARLWDVLVAFDVSRQVLFEWQFHIPTLVEVMNGDMRACLNLLESLPHDENSLEERISSIVALEVENLGAIAIQGEWMKLRSKLHGLLDEGMPLRHVTGTFYKHIRREYNASLTQPVLFDIMCAYGDIMVNIYTWPQDDYSFCDYLVARIRKEVKNK